MGYSSFPSCFSGRGRGGGDAAATQKPSSSSSSYSTTVAPSSTTSVYETPLGLAALTWSHAILGVSLRVDLRVPLFSSHSASDLHHHHSLSPSSPSPSFSSTTDQPPYPLTSLRFSLRPLLPWRRRGSHRFRFRHPPRTVDFAWDLSRAAFPASGSPEPRSRFSLSASLDGELLLAAGDRVPPLDPNPFLLASRIEHVVLPLSSSSSFSYATSVEVAGGGGRERVVALDLPAGAGDKDARMAVSIDGKKVLQVKRLRWKFRGSERVGVDTTAGGGALVSWDVHGWVFPGRTEGLPAGVEEAPAAARAELGWAVVVVRFDGAAEGGAGRGLWGVHGVVGCENCGEDRRKEGWRRRKKSLLKTRSSSSSVSSVSSAGGSSVMEWASAEENELRDSEGFTLVVYLWRR